MYSCVQISILLVQLFLLGINHNVICHIKQRRVRVCLGFFFFSIPRDHLCNLSLIDYADILPVANYRLAFLQIVASYWFEVFAARALDCNTFLTANCKCVEVWGTIGFFLFFFAHSGTTKIPNTRCGQSTHRKVVIGILTGKRKRLCKFFFL